MGNLPESRGGGGGGGGGNLAVIQWKLEEVKKLLASVLHLASW